MTMRALVILLLCLSRNGGGYYSTTVSPLMRRWPVELARVCGLSFPCIITPQRKETLMLWSSPRPCAARPKGFVRLLTLALLLLLTVPATMMSQQDHARRKPLLIAHRGPLGYAP